MASAQGSPKLTGGVGRDAERIAEDIVSRALNRGSRAEVIREGAR